MDFQLQAQVPPAEKKTDSNDSEAQDGLTRLCTQGAKDTSHQSQAHVHTTGMKPEQLLQITIKVFDFLYPQDEQDTLPSQAPDRRVDTKASFSEINTELQVYVKNDQERPGAFSPIVVEIFDEDILGVNTVSQLTLSRGGAALTAEISTLAETGSRVPLGDSLVLNVCCTKAVGIRNPSAAITTKAPMDDLCKGPHGGTCTVGAVSRGYHHISVWVALPPPAYTGGAALVWPPPLRPDSNTHAAAWWNSLSTADRAQTKAVSRLG
jgi:hypothetical protein